VLHGAIPTCQLDIKKPLRLNSIDQPVHKLKPVMKHATLVSPRDPTRVKFQAASPSEKRSHHNPKSSHTSGLSAELKTKVIDAGMNEKAYPKTGKEIKSQYLMNTVKIKPNSKGARGAAEVFSPLM